MTKNDELKARRRTRHTYNPPGEQTQDPLHERLRAARSVVDKATVAISKLNYAKFEILRKVGTDSKTVAGIDVT